jgi:hypothetical protein
MRVWLVALILALAGASKFEFGVYDGEDPGLDKLNHAGGWAAVDLPALLKVKSEFVDFYNKNGGLTVINGFKSKNCCFALKGGKMLSISATKYKVSFPASGGKLQCNPKDGYTMAKLQFHGVKTLSKSQTLTSLATMSVKTSHNPTLFARAMSVPPVAPLRRLREVADIAHVVFNPPAVAQWMRDFPFGEQRGISLSGGEQRAETAGEVAYGIGISMILAYWLWLCCSCFGCLFFRSVRPDGSPLARFILLVCFVVTGAISLGCIGGSNRINRGVAEVVDQFGNLADSAVRLCSAANDLQTETQQIVTAVHRLEKSCRASHPPSKFWTINAAANTAHTAAQHLRATLCLENTGIPMPYATDPAANTAHTRRIEQTIDMEKKQIKLQTQRLHNMPIAIILMLCVSCALGAHGALRKSVCSLTCASILGIVMLFFFIVPLVSAELSMNVFLADLCFEDPLVVAQQLLSRKSGYLSTRLKDFLACTGEGPLEEQFSIAQAQVSSRRQVSAY